MANKPIQHHDSLSDTDKPGQGFGLTVKPDQNRLKPAGLIGAKAQAVLDIARKCRKGLPYAGEFELVFPAAVQAGERVQEMIDLAEVVRTEFSSPEIFKIVFQAACQAEFGITAGGPGSPTGE